MESSCSWYADASVSNEKLAVPRGWKKAVSLRKDPETWRKRCSNVTFEQGKGK